MDSTTIELPGSEIESISLKEGALIVRFSRAIIIKTMSDSEEQTRWWQAGELVFDDAELSGALPDCPCVCEGGDVGENVYTYRDMLPFPLDSRGNPALLRKEFQRSPQTFQREFSSSRSWSHR